MNKAQKYRGPGRPSKYIDVYADELIEHMSKGLSFTSFAGECGVAVDTLYEWLHTYPDFRAARKVGNAKSLLYWETMGILGARGKIKLNAISWLFNMKVRFGWNENQLMEPQPEDDNEHLRSLPESELIKLGKEAVAFIEANVIKEEDEIKTT